MDENKKVCRMHKYNEPETILKGWEKTKLNREFDLDECMKDKDFEEEFLLNEQMKE